MSGLDAGMTSQPPFIKLVTTIFVILMLLGVTSDAQFGPVYPVAQLQEPFTQVPPFKQVTPSQGSVIMVVSQ
jgi:hypothetical protein